MMDYTCHILKVKILKRFCVVYGMAYLMTWKISVTNMNSSTG